MTDRHPLDQVPFGAAFTLLTLAADTGIISTITAAIQNFKATSMRASWGLAGLSAGDGPLLIGIADGELSLAEIEEYLEAAVTNARESPQAENALRPVQVLDTIGFRKESLWVVERILLPTFRENVGFTLFVYNTGVNMTTGAAIEIRGRLFGRWLD